uniref:Head decoration protein n=1 Tax=viral metagenome TaxID=1070528 RepID=A0A6M3J2C5_9ZZZZ
MAFADSQASAQIFYGDGEASIELAGTVTKGDILGNSGGWKRALATVSSVVQGRCVASEDGVSGQRISAYFGTVLMDDRLSGGTKGSALYVAEGTDNGEYTETAPTTTGDANKIVGYMVGASLAVIRPNMNDDSVA